MAETIGFIGLGGMGSRMAMRLQAAGYDLVVWNRSKDKLKDLLEAGAEEALSPADAAGRSDAVITMLADPEALRTVTRGDEGIAAGARAWLTVIEMSTVGPAAIAELAESLPEGVELMDAPVLGSLSEVEAGTLKIFVGGSDTSYSRWSDMFSSLGSPLHVGPVGSGAAAKLVANTTLFGTLGVLGEAIALADGLALDRDVAFEVLALTPLGAQAERRRDALDQGDFPLRFPLSLGKKDLDLIVSAADGAGVDVPTLEAARSWFARAVEEGWGERDYSAILARITESG